MRNSEQLVDVLSRRVFLTAQWRYLTMLNYAIEPALLQPYVPAGTELEYYRGQTYLSVVGFRFLDTCVFGVRVPYHRDFDEVNLRFYVRRHERGEVRRGVVFIREIAPRPAIAVVARLFYNEPYMALPMQHSIKVDAAQPSTFSTRFRWCVGGSWHGIRASVSGDLGAAPSGSLAEFITANYWGYSRRRDGRTMEYHVAHPPWQMLEAHDAIFEGDAGAVYGSALGAVIARPADSALIAAGSPITVFRGEYIA